MQYISDRSEAEFSHGICPECTRRLYGARTASAVKSAVEQDIPSF
jgi:hypothetical protein